MDPSFRLWDADIQTRRFRLEGAEIQTRRFVQTLDFKVPTKCSLNTLRPSSRPPSTSASSILFRSPSLVRIEIIRKFREKSQTKKAGRQSVDSNGNEQKKGKTLSLWFKKMCLPNWLKLPSRQMKAHVLIAMLCIWQRRSDKNDENAKAIHHDQ